METYYGHEEDEKGVTVKKLIHVTTAVPNI